MPTESTETRRERVKRFIRFLIVNRRPLAGENELSIAQRRTSSERSTVDPGSSFGFASRMPLENSAEMDRGAITILSAMEEASCLKFRGH